MKIKCVQLRQAVGLSTSFDANDFDIELDLQVQIVAVTPKKAESYKFRPRLIPLGNVAAIDGYTREELKRLDDRELARLQAEEDSKKGLEADPITVPVQPDQREPEPNSVDVIKFEKGAGGEITESRKVFQKAREAKP